MFDVFCCDSKPNLWKTSAVKGPHYSLFSAIRMDQICSYSAPKHLDLDINPSKMKDSIVVQYQILTGQVFFPFEPSLSFADAKHATCVRVVKVIQIITEQLIYVACNAG